MANQDIIDRLEHSRKTGGYVTPERICAWIEMLWPKTTDPVMTAKIKLKKRQDILFLWLRNRIHPNLPHRLSRPDWSRLKYIRPDKREEVIIEWTKQDFAYYGENSQSEFSYSLDDILAYIERFGLKPTCLEEAQPQMTFGLLQI